MALSDNRVVEYRLTEGEAETGHSVPAIVKSISMEVPCRALGVAASTAL
jgi:hypothetical protein